MPINVLKSRIADKKVTSFQKAQIGEYQKTAEYWFNLGCFYYESGLYNEAIEACKQAIRIKPDAAEAQGMLGVAYNGLGRYVEAVEAYKQAIRIKPDLALAHYGLGISYIILGRKSDALEEYKILKELDKELANKLFDLIYR
jgi:tetratricopeptide (TPR) repeat protein